MRYAVHRISAVAAIVLASCNTDVPGTAPAVSEDPSEYMVATDAHAQSLPHAALVATVTKVLDEYPATLTASRTLMGTDARSGGATGLVLGARQLPYIQKIGAFGYSGARAGDYVVSVEDYRMMPDKQGKVTVLLQHFTADGRRFWGHFHEVDIVGATSGTWSAPSMRSVVHFSGGIERPQG